MAKNPHPVLKNFVHNQFFLFRGNKTKKHYILWHGLTCGEARFFLSWDHSLRRMAIVSLKVLAGGKPTTGHGLVRLYLMQISHFPSKSLIWDFNSSSFISQSWSKLNSRSIWGWENYLWGFKATLYFSVLDKFCILLQRNTALVLHTFWSLSLLLSLIQ